jgi:adenylate cyclase class 2
MLEVEMKFPVVDFATVERCLTAWGARTEALRADVDLYFNSPDRDFAQTDEAFRLRRIGGVSVRSASCASGIAPAPTIRLRSSPMP